MSSYIKVSVCHVVRFVQIPYVSVLYCGLVQSVPMLITETAAEA
jgi:hypothetical protein